MGWPGAAEKRPPVLLCRGGRLFISCRGGYDPPGKAPLVKGGRATKWRGDSNEKPFLHRIPQSPPFGGDSPLSQGGLKRGGPQGS